MHCMCMQASLSLWIYIYTINMLSTIYRFSLHHHLCLLLININVRFWKAGARTPRTWWGADALHRTPQWTCASSIETRATNW